MTADDMSDRGFWFQTRNGWWVYSISHDLPPLPPEQRRIEATSSDKLSIQVRISRERMDRELES